MAATWEADRRLLETSRFSVTVLRERPAFVEARVAQGDATVLLQWVRDSAYRFFSLVEHEELGLALHPFDLATNKVLALVGRLEVRDWVDVIECAAAIQPMGYLMWAACGKDPGFSPAAILEHAGRSARYSADEVLELSFAGDPPDPGELSKRWHHLLDSAAKVIELLPAEEAGKCVLTRKRCSLPRRRLRATGGITSRRDRVPCGMHSRCLSACPRRPIRQDRGINTPRSAEIELRPLPRLRAPRASRGDHRGWPRPL